jgi:hypothetical protein
MMAVRMPGLCGAGIAGDAARRGGRVTQDDYRTGEKSAGISSVLACRIGRTPV